MLDDNAPVIRRKHAPVKVELAQEFRKEPTPTEKILWDRLRGGRHRGLHFRQQQVIAGFIVDFYCHTKRLVVEVDGAVHADQQPYDAERDKVLAQHGLRILRISADDVETRLSYTLDQITKAAFSAPPTTDPISPSTPD
ncbi:MAG: DUF559 domain-containing protein [Capsulimonas sp.]|uniref:endonuclease domain-containing protein n=1 Tax=Capsulimonas sp. TaxID=2494211 RepID=UPI00326416D9